MSKHKRNDRRGAKLSVPRLHLNLQPETKRDIIMIAFVVLGVVTVMSFFSIAGNLGERLLEFLKILFGVLGYVTPVAFFLIAYSLFRGRKAKDEYTGSYARVYLGVILFFGSLAGLIHIFSNQEAQDLFKLATTGHGGGFLGLIFAYPTVTLLGFAAQIVLFGLLFVGAIVTFNISLIGMFKKKTAAEMSERGKELGEIKVNRMTGSQFANEAVTEKNKKLSDKASNSTETSGHEVMSKNYKDMPKEARLDAAYFEERKDWKMPPFDLLEDNKTQADSGNIETNVAIIEKTLADFGIQVEMGEVNVGPTVTQYTFRPATGVKLSQIAALQNDLALALSAQSLRMELPIPGKPLVGLEIPNKVTAIVRLREVMETSQFLHNKNRLVLALGRDAAGLVQVVDLAKMPHLLVAGATGTGKSVAINSLLVSLLYRNTPQDVKLIVVDPKRVELNLYNGIPHLLTPVITDHDKAVNALKWAVNEMDRRYKLLAEAGNRNIVDYNEANELRLPYIVVVVDELADLMAVSQADVESAIVRLAQMARAVGIHLVLATQRPSVEVITGLIKANITSRIAFTVASQIDSRTILDGSGAEKLLGRGDMLFVSAEFNKPKRVQSSFIGEKEVKKVVDFFKKQVGSVVYNEEITEKPRMGMNIPGFSGDSDGVDDDLYEQAVEEVRNAGKASASLLQRRLRIGYARAARLLDILEDKGIIGPGDGAKPREVYGAMMGSGSENTEETSNSPE